jgi:hypothetical protein
MLQSWMIKVFLKSVGFFLNVSPLELYKNDSLLSFLFVQEFI